MRPMIRRLFARRAMLPDEWASDVLIALGDDGTIASVTPNAPPGNAERAAGPVIPGMPSLHSHAFQRAMAGLAERMGSREDSFWTWREVMYGFLDRLQPHDAHAVATQLYVEMLKHGYTSVAEFHYVHRDPEGKPYANKAEMACAHVHAAREVGIAITMLPVLYAHSGFGAAALRVQQRRFASTPADVLDVLRTVRDAHREDPDVRVGIAPHSLRAVRPAASRRASTRARRDRADRPGAHACGRADARGRRLRRMERPTARRMAARSCPGRCALVPRALHAHDG